MHSPLSFAVIISLVTLILSASASPLSSVRGTPKCSARDIAIVRRTISDEVYFCKWWLSDIRTRTPFLEFSPAQVTDLCKCIVPVTTKKTTTKQKRAEHTALSTLEKRQTIASCRAEMSVQFTEPYHFCTFYNSYPRTTSPFVKYSAKDLVKLCKCVEGKAVSTPTSKISTKKITASSTKVSTKAPSKTSSIKPSTKLSSSSSKPVSKTTTKTTPRIPSTTSSSSSKVASSATSKTSSKISSKTSSKSSSRVVSATSSNTSKVTVGTSSKPSTTSTSRSSLVSGSPIPSSRVSTSSPKSSTSSLASSKAPVIPISIPSISTSAKVPGSSQSVSSAESTLQTPSSSFSLSVIPDSVTISTPSVTVTPSSSTDTSSSYITESSSTDTQVSSTSEVLTTETASSTDSSASTTTTSSTSSVAPLSTGFLMAKGGVVDGQYWNTEVYSAIPAFSSSLETRVVCTLGDDRVLTCDGFPVNILGYGLYGQIDPMYGVGDSTLKCDRAPDGLLHCDTITFSDVVSNGPFATCVSNYGNTLHYLEHADMSDCTSIDGLYLVYPEPPSSSSTTSSSTGSPTPDVITSSTSSSTESFTPTVITSSTSSSEVPPTIDVTTSSTSSEESPTSVMTTSFTSSSEESPTPGMITPSVSSSEASPTPPATASSTSATYPLATGVLMAKGGVVDGQYWNNARSNRVPAFSSLETNMVSCSLGDDRVLVCNGLPVNIIGSGLYAATSGGVSSYTLNCDRAADGLLTCDPINNGIYSRGPFATCLTDYGKSLHYFGNTTLTSCTVIDGLYLN